MSRNQIYITQEQFDFFCQTQRPYEGFVEGVGYAFVHRGFVNPHANRPTNPFRQTKGYVNIPSNVLNFFLCALGIVFPM